MFRDINGQVSSMRVMSFMIILVILSGWAYTVIYNKEFVDFGANNMLVLLTALGAKAIQRGVER